MSDVIDDRVLLVPQYSPVCSTCEHLDPDEFRQCIAFDEIPLDIWLGKNNHRKPVEGDRGIQYEQWKLR